MILKPEHLFLKTTFSKDIVWRQRLDTYFFPLFLKEKYTWTESQNQNGLKNIGCPWTANFGTILILIFMLYFNWKFNLGFKLGLMYICSIGVF